MKEKTYILPMLLGVVLILAMVAAVLVKTFAPAVVLPPMNIPNLAGLSLIVLLMEHYFAPKAGRCYICVFAFSLLAFGLLPAAAGYIHTQYCLKLALVGSILFTLLTCLFDSIVDRLSTGPKAKLAPLIGAFGLYLAFQAFAGILL
ncbi:MAG: hypothetical protein IKM59_01830 [Oscillospiraceae bacterium]|nr:hypothetical protein [Oscillospiraceae bacterium]